MSQQAERNAAPEINPENPWPGLASFTEEQRAFFFGREEETAELLRRVRGKVLTVLFGQSGLGKTSLVNAGLSPRLREEDMVPIVVRLNHDPAAPAGGLADQVRAAISQTIAQRLLDGPLPDPAQTLWEYFHQHGLELWTPRNRPATVVLIFDQFEEIYTLGRSSELTRERGRLFAAELADLIENRPPASVRTADEESGDAAPPFDFGPAPCKVLLCLREDYLPDLEGFRRQAPSIAENRQRLQLMDGRQALHVLCGAGGKLIDRATAIKVVRFVGGATQAPDNPADEEAALEGLRIEPALLSIFAHELNRKRQAQGLPRITADLLEGQRDRIITDFYERSLADLPPAVRPFIEDRLLTPSGYRDSLAMEIATGPGGLPVAVIDQLVARRLLHVDQRLGSQRLELTHDVLTGAVRASRAARLQGQAVLQAREREKAVRAQLRRARQRLMVASALAVLMLGLAVFSYFSWRQAQAAVQRAEEQKAAAERSANLARSSIEHTLMKLEWDEAVTVVNSMSTDPSAGNTAEILQGLADKYAAQGQRTQEIRARLWLAHVNGGAVEPWIAHNADELATLVLGLMVQTDEANWPHLEEFFSPACPAICDCITRRLADLATRSSPAERRAAVALGQYTHAPLWFAGRGAPQDWVTANAPNLEKIMLDVMANQDQSRWKDDVDFFAPAYAAILGRITGGIGELVDAEDINGKRLDAAVAFGARPPAAAPAAAGGAAAGAAQRAQRSNLSLGNPVQRAIDSYRQSKAAVSQPDPGAVLARGGGALTSTFAFCQNLPLPDALQAAAILRKKDYQLRTFRPCNTPDGQLLVTARWEHAGPASLLRIDLTAVQVRDQEREMWLDGYEPADLTLYETTAENGQRQDRFALVWQKADRVAPRYQLYMAVPENEFITRTGKSIGPAFTAVTAQLVVGRDGVTHFYGIATTDPAYQAVIARWRLDFQNLAVEPAQGDLRVMLDVRPHTVQTPDITLYWERMKADEEAQLQAKPDDLKVARTRAEALLHLGRTRDAADALAAKPFDPQAPGEEALYWRTIARARLGDLAGAQADLKALAVLRDPKLSSMVYLRGLIAVCGGAAVPDEVIKLASADTAGDLYDAACVYAWAAGMTSRGPAERDQLAGRALDILRQAVRKGYDDGTWTWTDSDMSAIRTRPEFAQILAAIPRHPLYIQTCLVVPRGVSLEGISTLQTGTAGDLVQAAAAHARAGDTLAALMGPDDGATGLALWAPQPHMAAVVSARSSAYQKKARADLRQSLHYDTASDNAKKWWDGFEHDNVDSPTFILSIMRELDSRHATIDEFYDAWSSAKCYYFRPDLHYLDFMRTQKVFTTGQATQPPPDRYAAFLKWMAQPPTVTVTDVHAMTPAQIAALIEKDKTALAFSQASADARTWWARIESDNARRPALVLRLLEELDSRQGGPACFDALFGAAADAHTNDLLGQLQYMDYLAEWRNQTSQGSASAPSAAPSPLIDLLETYARNRLLGRAPPALPAPPAVTSPADLDAAIGAWCTALQDYPGESSSDLVYYGSTACSGLIRDAIARGIAPDLAAIALRISKAIYGAVGEEHITVFLAANLPDAGTLDAAGQAALTKVRASVVAVYKDQVFNFIQRHGLGTYADPATYAEHDTSRSTAGLPLLFADLVRAYCQCDLGKAGDLLAQLKPDEKALRALLADDVPPDVLRRILAQPYPTADDIGQRGLWGFAPDVYAQRTSMEHIRTSDLTASIAQYLRPGTEFYEVQLDDQDSDLHRTIPLIFWDGTHWKMLPPLWEIPDLQPSGK